MRRWRRSPRPSCREGSSPRAVSPWACFLFFARRLSKRAPVGRADCGACCCWGSWRVVEAAGFVVVVLPKPKPPRPPPRPPPAVDANKLPAAGCWVTVAVEAPKPRVLPKRLGAAVVAGWAGVAAGAPKRDCFGVVVEAPKSEEPRAVEGWAAVVAAAPAAGVEAPKREAPGVVVLAAGVVEPKREEPVLAPKTLLPAPVAAGVGVAVLWPNRLPPPKLPVASVVAGVPLPPKSDVMVVPGRGVLRVRDGDAFCSEARRWARRVAAGKC